MVTQSRKSEGLPQLHEPEVDGEEMTYIYALVDPRTNECRYIGKTVNPAIRYKDHLKDKSRTWKSNWINSLLPLKPVLVILEEVEGAGNSEERHWIAYMKFIGAALTNLTLGGDGTLGWTATPEIRKRLSDNAKSRPVEWITKWCLAGQTQEVREKLRQTRIGRTASDETKAKMSKAHTGSNNAFYGKTHSKEVRKKLSEIAKRRTGRTMSEEHRQKLQEGYYRHLNQKRSITP